MQAATTASRTHFLQERGLDGEILGHHVKAEEMAVNPRAGHREAVHMLVLLGRDLEQPEPLFSLNEKRWEGSSCAVRLEAPRPRGRARLCGGPMGDLQEQETGDGQEGLRRPPDQEPRPLTAPSFPGC